jgi:hypothetical protein
VLVAVLAATLCTVPSAVCQSDVVPFAQAPAAQSLAAGGSASKAARIPPAVRRLLLDS